MRARGMRDMAYIANLRGKTLDALRKNPKASVSGLSRRFVPIYLNTIYEVWDF